MTTAETIRPEDLVVGLLAEVRQKMGSERFEADPVSVHTRFFEWRNKEEFSNLFDLFVFDTRDYFLTQKRWIVCWTGCSWLGIWRGQIPGGRGT